MKKLIWAILIAAVLFGLLFFFTRPAEAKGDNGFEPKPYWTEWKDTTRCKILQCGTDTGVKGQERQLVVEQCDYSCPVVKWKGFKVKYNKSQDPTKCHRPSVAQLKKDHRMTRVQALKFTKENPQWKKAITGECELKVLETQHRRIECKGDGYACGTERWCVPCDEGEHKYCAEAIPTNEKPPEDSKKWEEGMDKWCEYDKPDPEPEPKDEPKKFTEDTRCHDATPPAITWMEITDGSASNNWHPEATWSAEGGDTIGVKFSDDPDNLKWRFTMENDGHETLGYMHNTGLLGMVDYCYKFRTINGCSEGEWSDLVCAFN